MLNILTVKKCHQNGIDPKAVELLLEAINVAEPGQNTRHVSGQNLCMAIREILLDRCGPLGSAVLNHYGIKTTEDIGKLVFKLIDLEILAKDDNDTLKDFTNVFDIKEEFNIVRYLEQQDV